MVFLAVVLPTQTEVHLAIKILAEELLLKKTPKNSQNNTKQFYPPKNPKQTKKQIRKTHWFLKKLQREDLNLCHGDDMDVSPNQA